MATSSTCKAKNPIYCRHHGVKQPDFTINGVKNDLKSINSKIASVANSGATSEFFELQKEKHLKEAKLSYFKNKKFFGTKVDLGMQEREVKAEIKRERKTYEQEVFKRVFGENSDEYYVATHNDLKDIEANPDRHDVFYIRSEYNDSVNTYVKEAENNEVMAELNAYIKEHQLDGYVKRQANQFSQWVLVPFKLKENQMHPERFRSVQQSEAYRSTMDEVHKALNLMEDGKAKKLSD